MKGNAGLVIVAVVIVIIVMIIVLNVFGLNLIDVLNNMIRGAVESGKTAVGGN